jgi:hypothetical protein
MYVCVCAWYARVCVCVCVWYARVCVCVCVVAPYFSRCSKFWRERCREEALLSRGSSSNSSRDNSGGGSSSNSSSGTSARSRVHHMCATNTNKAVQKFLQREEQRLRASIERVARRCHCDEVAEAEAEALATLHYQRGTFLECLMDKAAAHCAFAEALALVEPLVASLPTAGEVSDWPPLVQKRDLFRSCVLRMQVEFDMAEQELRWEEATPVSCPSTVERVPFGSMTYSQFLERYAHRSTPVIFTGAAEHMLGDDFDWSLDGIAASPLGGCTVVPKVRIPESCEWAQHESCSGRLLKEFIDELQRHDTSSNDSFARPLEYVVDWSLAQHCPELARHNDGNALRLPALCSIDWLQQVPPGSLYRDSWPSLFVGPADTSSGLHTGLTTLIC